MADLKEQYSRLMKMSWEIHEMLKTTSSNNAFGRTRLLIGLLASDTGNLD
jgi:hypothetical protein